MAVWIAEPMSVKERWASVTGAPSTYRSVPEMPVFACSGSITGGEGAVEAIGRVPDLVQANSRMLVRIADVECLQICSANASRQTICAFLAWNERLPAHSSVRSLRASPRRRWPVPPHRSLASPTLSARRRPPGSQSTLLPGSPSSLPRPRTASLPRRRSPSPSPRRPSPSVHPDRRRAVYTHAVKPSTPVATVDPYAPSPVTMEPPPPFAARTRLLPSVGPRRPPLLTYCRCPGPTAPARYLPAHSTSPRARSACPSPVEPACERQ